MAIKLVGLLQSVVLLTVATWGGVVLSPKVALSAPFSEAIANRSVRPWQAIQPQLIPAALGGLMGLGLTLIWFAILKPFLPSDFLSAGSQMTVPFIVRLLKGGIAEEIVLRWGLMTFLLWALWRFLQRRKGTPYMRYVVISILVSAIVFGLLHLPAVAVLSTEITPALVLYIVVGNALFGTIACAGCIRYKRVAWPVVTSWFQPICCTSAKRPKLYSRISVLASWTRECHFGPYACSRLFDHGSIASAFSFCLATKTIGDIKHDI
ncbi:MAG: CPBP family intramembrane metalloprotease [Phormidesmis sp. RL_2_1]|nr:CPBP family intramembrane metalloprotease [Phormidesmis sp. RL_2_1]